MGFQNRVNLQPGVATVGDFADANIRAVVLAGAGALVAAAAPRSPIVGHFAWGNQSTGLAAGDYRGEAAAKIGFLHRENNAIIVPFLAGQQMYLEAGQLVTLFDQGSFWAEFPAGAVVGEKAFARYLDGSVYSAAAGTSTVSVSAMTGALVGATGVLTIASLTGTLAVGDVISGSPFAVSVAVLSQLSGTPGGIGTYLTTGVANVADVTGAVAHNAVETSFYVDSPAAADASITGSIAAATGILTVTAVASGVLVAGQLVSGVGVPPNTQIVAQLTGSAGSTGTYSTNLVVGPVVTSRALVASQGQLAKISTWG